MYSSHLLASDSALTTGKHTLLLGHPTDVLDLRFLPMYLTKWSICQGIPFAVKTILIWNHDCFDCHGEWNSERDIEMCRDFLFARFHLLAFHFNEFRTCRTQPSLISCQTVQGSLGFAQTIKTSKVDRWFGSIGNQDCNRTKGTSFIAMKPHFGYNPDCFDYERNAMYIT